MFQYTFVLLQAKTYVGALLYKAINISVENIPGFHNERSLNSSNLIPLTIQLNPTQKFTPNFF